MANEESFQSLTVERTGDLSANGKRKGRAAVENQRTVKSGRRCDAEVDRVIELTGRKIMSVGCILQELSCLPSP